MYVLHFTEIVMDHKNWIIKYRSFTQCETLTGYYPIPTLIIILFNGTGDSEGASPASGKLVIIVRENVLLIRLQLCLSTVCFSWIGIQRRGTLNRFKEYIFQEIRDGLD